MRELVGGVRGRAEFAWTTATPGLTHRLAKVLLHTHTQGATDTQAHWWSIDIMVALDW